MTCEDCKHLIDKQLRKVCENRVFASPLRARRGQVLKMGEGCWMFCMPCTKGEYA